MQAKTLFLLKFLLLITVLLPIWLAGAVPHYIQILSVESALALRALGYTVLKAATDETHIILQLDMDYSVKFEAITATLNLIVFVTLVLSTSGVPWKRRIGYFLGGILALNLYQLLYVVAHFIVNFRYGADSPVLGTLTSISEVCTLLLPMLLWSLMEAPVLFKRRRPAESSRVVT